MAHGSEPSAPASDTAVARALPCTPAIGAWMMGSSMPSICRNIMGIGLLGPPKLIRATSAPVR